jgi:hypothetical protein
MSILCSIELCKQPPSVFCHTCNKHFCNEHLNEHDDQLNIQLNSLTDQIKILSHRYIALDTNKLIQNYQQKLNKWRDDCYQTIDRLYKEKCEELDQDWTRKLDKPEKDMERMQIKLNQLIQKQKSTHEDIHQSILGIQYIDQEINEIEQKGIQIDIRPLLIDNQPKIQDINAFNLSSPYRSIDCSGHSGVTFAGNSQYLLVYEYHNLILFNQDLRIVQQCPWIYGHIYNMCWSTVLNNFIVITYKRLVYLINEYPLSFTRIISIPQDKWWSCTSSDKSLFLTTYGIDGSVCEFNLLFSFKLIKQWRSPYTCKQHERIHDINYTNQTLALAIGDPLTKTARIELRSSSTLTRLWSLSLDIDELLYQPSIHCCPLKFNEWLVTIENTSSLFHISKDGQLKTIHTFKHFVRNAISFASNVLAIRTENNLFFHQI